MLAPETGEREEDGASIGGGIRLEQTGGDEGFPQGAEDGGCAREESRWGGRSCRNRTDQRGRRRSGLKGRMVVYGRRPRRRVRQSDPPPASARYPAPAASPNRRRDVVLRPSVSCSDEEDSQWQRVKEGASVKSTAAPVELVRARRNRRKGSKSTETRSMGVRPTDRSGRRGGPFEGWP